MVKASKFAVGSVVALNADLAWVYPSSVNVLFEVADARLANGSYTYTLRHISGHEGPRDVPADDLHAVRC